MPTRVFRILSCDYLRIYYDNLLLVKDFEHLLSIREALYLPTKKMYTSCNYKLKITKQYLKIGQICLKMI